jgi:hypothetical protein
MALFISIFWQKKKTIKIISEVAVARCFPKYFRPYGL